MHTFILRQFAFEGTGMFTATLPSLALLATSRSITVLCPLIMAVTLILEPGEGEPSALVTIAYARVYARMSQY